MQDSLCAAGRVPRNALQTSIKSQFFQDLSLLGDGHQKWLQERLNGPQNNPGIVLEGPGVVGMFRLAGPCTTAEQKVNNLTGFDDFPKKWLRPRPDPSPDCLKCANSIDNSRRSGGTPVEVHFFGDQICTKHFREVISVKTNCPSERGLEYTVF